MSQISKICNFLLTDDDRKRFCEEILQKIGYDETFLYSYDVAKLRPEDTVNSKNCRIQGGQQPQKIIEHQWGTPKVAAVAEVMFVNTWRETEYRFDVC
jgi:hypothetical protein